MAKKETIIDKAIKLKEEIELVKKRVALLQRSCGKKKWKKDKKTGQYLLF